MRKLIALVLVVAGLWAGYWYVASTTKHQVIATWLNERRADGWTVKYSDFRVVGFPNRLDSKFTDLDLYDPRSGIGWTAPEFDILALSYQPNHIIAIWPTQQNLRFPHEDVNITSKELRASVVFEPDTRLAVSRISVEAADLLLKSTAGWQGSIGSLHLSSRQHRGKAFAHDVVFDAKSVSPTADLRARLDPSGQLPKALETLYLDMTLGFDAPWDRVAIEKGAPLLTRITLNKANAVWGDLGVSGQGDLAVAADGQISGQLEVTLRNWRAVVDLFVASGAIDSGTAQTIKSALGLFTGSDSSLKTSLTLADGNMSLGPIRIGPAPRLVWR